MNLLNIFVINNVSPHFNLIYYGTECNHDGKYLYSNQNIKGIIDELEIINLYNETITKILYQLSKFSSSIIEDKFNNFNNFPKSYEKVNHILNLIKKEKKSY